MITGIFVEDDPGGLAQVGDTLSFSLGWSLFEFKVNDPPRLLYLVDQLGNRMPAWPPVYLHQDLPAYLAFPHAVVNGELSVYALGEGDANIYAEYTDPLTGLQVESILGFTVVGSSPVLTPAQGFQLYWGEDPLYWGDQPLIWD